MTGYKGLSGSLVGRTWRLRRLGSVLLATALIFQACSGRPEPVTRPAVPNGDREVLESPVRSFPRSMDPVSQREIGAAHSKLVTEGDTAEARRVASTLLARNPELAPAKVLDGQARVLEGDLGGASRVLHQVVDEHPHYAAAQLALGLTAERLGEPLVAYVAYEAVAATRSVAAKRAAELRPRALEILGLRVRDALARGRLDDAEESLDTLAHWDPEGDSTLELSFEMAEAVDDLEAQLEWIRRLAERSPESIEYLSRWGQLEMRGGDATQALEIFQELHDEFPEEAEFEEELDRAKFIWRLRNLPPRVAETVAKPELTRADFAVLMYWLVPGVRAGSQAQPRIATDILDHPRRQEIMRVVNLDLMTLDGNVREFRPSDSLVRVEGLRALLLAMRNYEPAPACLGATGGPLVAWDTVCRLSATCGTLPSVQDCLPSAPVSGREALEWIRNAVSF